MSDDAGVPSPEPDLEPGPPPERALRSIDRRRARTRAEILAAAWSVCREHGLAALSLREIGERVGMRPPSLYSYYDSKDAIYDAMFAEGQVELAALLEAQPADGPVRDVLRAGVRAFFEFCVNDPIRYQLMFQRTLPGFEPSPGSYALAVANLETLSSRLATAGVTDQRHVDLWTAVVTGLTDQQISNDPGGDRWARLLDEAVELLSDHMDLPSDPITSVPNPSSTNEGALS
jgi:AcrR family transcriptional regulator